MVTGDVAKRSAKNVGDDCGCTALVCDGLEELELRTTTPEHDQLLHAIAEQIIREHCVVCRLRSRSKSAVQLVDQLIIKK